jgi:hypothetical protein
LDWAHDRLGYVASCLSFDKLRMQLRMLSRLNLLNGLVVRASALEDALKRTHRTVGNVFLEARGLEVKDGTIPSPSP